MKFNTLGTYLVFIQIFRGKLNVYALFLSGLSLNSDVDELLINLKSLNAVFNPAVSERKKNYQFPLEHRLADQVSHYRILKHVLHLSLSFPRE